MAKRQVGYLVRFCEGLYSWRAAEDQSECRRASPCRKRSQADGQLYGVSTNVAAVRGYKGVLNSVDPRNRHKSVTRVSCWRCAGAIVCDCYDSIAT